LLDEFYRIAFRKKLYRSIADLQRDVDAWLVEYNETRPHQGRWCYGKTPMQTFIVTAAKSRIGSLGGMARDFGASRVHQNSLPLTMRLSHARLHRRPACFSP
jgi:hypothetical protein